MQLKIYSKEKNFEDKYALFRLETIFTKKRNYSFRMPQRKKSVILLLSGGLDSVCLWNLLMDKYNLVVYPIYFNSLTRRSEGQEESVEVFSRLFKNLYPCQFREVFKVDYSLLYSPLAN